jgi:metal-responsive CopG/Arc/MetJ family transcriptional regulator
MVARVQVADVRIPAIAFWYNQGYTFNMKTAISIPDRVFREAERAAKRQKVSRSRFYSQAVEAYLKAQANKGITEALNAVYATEDSSLNPVVARMQSLSVGHEEW